MYANTKFSFLQSVVKDYLILNSILITCGDGDGSEKEVGVKFESLEISSNII